MRTIGLVAKHAILTTLKTRSFWIMTIILPAFLLGFQAYFAIQESGTGNGSDSSGEDAQSATPTSLPAIGFIDEAGIIKNIPAGFPPDLLVRYSNTSAARSALESGAIEQYIFIPADYLTSGQVKIYDRDFQIAESGKGTGLAFGGPYEWMLGYLIDYNLTGDEYLATALRNPTPGKLTEYHMIAPPAQAETTDQTMALIVGRVMPYLFYFILMVGSSYLLRSVTAEKENRTAEVLLLSVDARELMAGKVIGLGFVAFLQLLVWLGGGYLIFQGSAALLKIATINFSPSLIFWAALYLVFGYLVYGGIMAAGGAIAPTSREGNQLTWLLVIPLMPTLMFASEFAENPNGVLPLVLSLFPFSAPSAMVTRLAITEVPVWQLLISLVGLAITSYFFIVLAGRLFRADNLLSSASFSWRRLLNGWRSS